MTETQVRKLLADACRECGSQRTFARRHRISGPFLSHVLAGIKAPSDAICRALKIKRVVSYEVLS